MWLKVNFLLSEKTKTYIKLYIACDVMFGYTKGNETNNSICNKVISAQL